MDLAIVGDNVFKGMDAADDSEFKVDIVSLERQPVQPRDRVKRHGVPLISASR